MHDDHDHPHDHDHWDSPGAFTDRAAPLRRDFARRAFTVGIGGPVGSGKTALVLALCRALRDRRSLGVVTNDIFTREDAEFLARHDALPLDRIRAVETGGCPHAAIREDITPNLVALDALMRDVAPELLVVESGGDNLAAQYSRELADYTIYVVDVAGGDGAGNCERVRGRLGHVSGGDRFAPGKRAGWYADEAHRRIRGEAAGEGFPVARSDAVVERRDVLGGPQADRFSAHLSSGVRNRRSGTAGRGTPAGLGPGSSPWRRRAG